MQPGTLCSINMEIGEWYGQTNVCWNGTWSQPGRLQNASTYSDTCQVCDRTTYIGVHAVCMLSKVSGPGSTDTICEVIKSGVNWYLRIRDGLDDSQSQSCGVTCMD
jgi:hypothetical protein